MMEKQVLLQPDLGCEVHPSYFFGELNWPLGFQICTALISLQIAQLCVDLLIVLLTISQQRVSVCADL